MQKDIIEPGFVYHIYNRGNNKESIFKEEKNYYYFLNLMEKYLFPLADVYAYCLLDNHFHLLVHIKDEEDLPDKLKEKPYLPFSNWFNAYTKSINKAYNRAGSLFQEHLKRKRVLDEKYLVQLVAYIHLNPVKHNFTDDYKTYRFSSYQAYSSNKPTKVKVDFIRQFMDEESFEAWHNLNRITNLLEED